MASSLRVSRYSVLQQAKLTMVLYIHLSERHFGMQRTENTPNVGVNKNDVLYCTCDKKLGFVALYFF